MQIYSLQSEAQQRDNQIEEISKMKIQDYMIKLITTMKNNLITQIAEKLSKISLEFQHKWDHFIKI